MKKSYIALIAMLISSLASANCAEYYRGKIKDIQNISELRAVAEPFVGFAGGSVLAIGTTAVLGTTGFIFIAPIVLTGTFSFTIHREIVTAKLKEIEKMLEAVSRGAQNKELRKFVVSAIKKSKKNGIVLTHDDVTARLAALDNMDAFCSKRDRKDRVVLSNKVNIMEQVLNL